MIDGYDLLTFDLDKIPDVEDWRLHDENRVLVRLRDGRRFMLIAEEQSA